MAEALVLIDTYPGDVESVYRSLDEFPEVIAKRRVQDGVIDVVVRVRAPTAQDIMHFVATTLRFVAGVRTVEEVHDVEEYFGDVRRAIVDLAR